MTYQRWLASAIARQTDRGAIELLKIEKSLMKLDKQLRYKQLRQK
jgi:hypothetical protein